MTTLKLISDPGVLLTLGGQWTLAVETRDVNGYLTASVTPTLLITLPDGSTAAPVFAPIVANFGRWYATYTPAVAGRFLARAATPEDAVDAAAYAAGPTAGAGMPNVNDIARYLKGGAASWSAADLQEELDAEASAQRDVCGVPAVYPPSLAKALKRRVQRALAMRGLPLAVMQGDADGGANILPGRDPEVRRFEGPYRKLGCG